MEITWRVISGEWAGENRRKGQGIRSLTGRYKRDRRRLRIAYEMEKPKNLCMTHGHERRWGGGQCGGREGTGWRGIKGRKKRAIVIA